MAKIQINSETFLFLKIFLFGKPVSLLLGIIMKYRYDIDKKDKRKRRIALL